MHARSALAFAIAIALTACLPSSRLRDAGPSPDATVRPDAGSRDAGSPPPELDDVVLDDDAIAAIDPSTLPTGVVPCRPPALVRVAWTSDGDTIEAEDPTTGARERVRIIGIDTPEIAHEAGTTDDCFGREASDFTSALSGHLVWLTFENGCLDRYDRTLAHVHVSAAAPDGSWARQLLLRGFARTLPVSPNRTFERTFADDQAIARSAARGLWSACP